jgi:hypothetical protein
MLYCVIGVLGDAADTCTPVWKAIASLETIASPGLSVSQMQPGRESARIQSRFSKKTALGLCATRTAAERAQWSRERTGPGPCFQKTGLDLCASGTANIRCIRGRSSWSFVYAIALVLSLRSSSPPRHGQVVMAFWLSALLLARLRFHTALGLALTGPLWLSVSTCQRFECTNRSSCHPR